MHIHKHTFKTNKNTQLGLIGKHHMQSLIVSRILYALPAWGGFLSVELKGRINAFLRRLYKQSINNQSINKFLGWPKYSDGQKLTKKLATKSLTNFF